MAALDQLAAFCDEGRRHLLVISEDIRWCFADGFHPRGKSTAAVGQGATMVIDAGPDHVPGARWDIGQANARARQAFRVACRHLRVAELRVSCVLLAAARPQPPFCQPNGAQLSPALRCAETLTERLDLLQLSHSALQGLPARQWADLLWGQPQAGGANAINALYRARAVLHAVFGGEHVEQPAVAWCQVCGIRALDGNARAGRCRTCRAYWQRKGQERPTTLDRDTTGVAQARKTAARHRQMGHGYGFS